MINHTRRRHLPATLLFAVVLVGAMAPAASAGQPIMSPPSSRDAVPAAAADEILIRYRAGTTQAQRRAIAREHGLSTVAGGANGRTEVVVAKGRSAAATRRHLAEEPAVVAVAPNHRRELVDDITDEPDFANEWGLHNTGQPIDGGQLLTGVSNVDIDGLQALRLGIGDPAVVVAVVDDGIDFDHPDLAARAWTNPGEAGPLATNGIDDDANGYVDDVHGWDFCNNDNTVHDPGADWHGTHVSGTIAASLDGTGVVGVAPGVQLMALKFIDEGYECGTDGMAVDAIDYAASFGVRIINASWGGPESSTVLDAAIASSGALFVAAAGNAGQNMDGKNRDGSTGVRFYPAASPVPGIVSVAAIDQKGRLASFSNYGKTSVDLVAPGTNILSTIPAQPGCSAPCYAWAGGTSMAAPHVTGVAALVGSRLPALLAQPTAMRSRLLATGRGLTAAVGTTATGRMVNALRAIDTAAPTASAPDRFSVSLGSVVSSTSFTGAVRWNAASDPMSGIASYAVKRKSPNGWSTVDASTSDLFVRSPLRFGSAYTFRLRATDRAGNVSGAADGPSVKASLYSDGTAAARYSGSWRTVSSSSALRSSVHTSSKAGAWATYRFTGRSIAIVAPKGPTRGKFRVYVDGTLISTVDLQRSSTKARMAVFAKAWPTSGTHTVKLVIVGSKRVDIDGFVVIR